MTFEGSAGERAPSGASLPFPRSEASGLIDREARELASNAAYSDSQTQKDDALILHPFTKGPLRSHSKTLPGQAYSANVQSKASHYFERCLPNGHILGSGYEPTSSDCGNVDSVVVCKDSGDLSFRGKHAHYPKYHRCNDPDCLVCYVKFAKRIADGAVEKAMAFISLYPDKPLYHLIHSSPNGTQYKNMKEAFASHHKNLKKLGSQAAASWSHPYRIRDELKPLLRDYKTENGLDRAVGFWRLAHDDVLERGALGYYVTPGYHFHSLTTGYLTNSAEYEKKTGWVYKKKGYWDAKTKKMVYDLRVFMNGRAGPIDYKKTEDNVRRVAYYLSTHACHEWTKQTVRYTGLMANNKLHRAVESVVYQPVLCPCGAQCEERRWDSITETAGEVIKEVVCQRVTLYVYWKDGDPPPVLPDKPAQVESPPQSHYDGARGVWVHRVGEDYVDDL